MTPHDPIQTPEPVAGPSDATPVTHHDIARYVRRGEAERARYIAELGQRMWRTLSSLWRRPSQIPTSYRTNG